MPVDISVDLWGLMTDKCAPSLSFPKRLNTLGDPNTHYPPGEHCFEAQKMTIKVTDDGDTQNQGTWHLKGHLGMDSLRERGGRSLAFKREGGRNSGWGRSWFGRVWSLCHLGESSPRYRLKNYRCKIRYQVWRGPAALGFLENLFLPCLLFLLREAHGRNLHQAPECQPVATADKLVIWKPHFVNTSLWHSFPLRGFPQIREIQNLSSENFLEQLPCYLWFSEAT